MIGFGAMIFAAADAPLLDVADPRSAEHHPYRVTGRTALAAQRPPADFTYYTLAGHFQKIVLGQPSRQRQRPRPRCAAIGCGLSRTQSPFF